MSDESNLAETPDDEVAEPYPSTVFLFWPWAEPPMEEEVRLTVRGLASPVEDDEELGGDDAIHWAKAYRVEDHPVPILVWVCPREEVVSSWGFERVRWGEGEEEQAKGAKWLLGVETLLDPADPLSSFHLQMRFCHALRSDAPAVYDACSYRIWPGSEVERLTSTKVPPRTDRLFSIHAVTSDDGEDPTECWIHTHGLNRAGCPELDLLGISAELCDAASTLLNGVADLLIGSDLPDPGAAFEVGSGRSIAWRPWEEAIVELPDTILGGLDDRQGDGNPHGGNRVILVAEDGEPSELWTPPLDVVNHIDQQDGILFVSRRETERMAKLALERWSEFAMLFVRHKNDGWQFLTKMGYVIDGGEPDEREHLWFEVKEIAPDRVRAKLLNSPLRIERMAEGELDWHDLERLTDWNMCTPMGTFTPENVEYLWDAARKEDGGA